MAASTTYNTQQAVFYQTVEFIYPQTQFEAQIPWRDNFPILGSESDTFVLIRSVGNQPAGLYTSFRNDRILVVPYAEVSESVSRDAFFKIYLGVGLDELPAHSKVYKNGTRVNVTSFTPDPSSIYVVISVPLQGTGTVQSVNSELPDDSGNVKINIPDTSNLVTDEQFTSFADKLASRSPNEGASMIGVSLPYTGLSPLTQALMNAGIPLTPTMFGAVNDGSTDNTAALFAFAQALTVKMFWGRNVWTNSLGRFAFGPNIPSELGQYTTAFGERAGVGATSTNSDGSPRTKSTPGNSGAVELADYGAFFGNQAGFNSQSHAHTAMGNHAGFEHHGYAAAFFGQKAGKQSTGTHMAGHGYRALNDANGNRLNGHGYASGRFSSGDDCVYYGYFSGWAHTGSFCSFYGTWSGHCSIGNQQSAIGDTAGRAMIGDGAMAWGANATCQALGTPFTITADDIDIELSRFRVPDGTAVSLNLNNLDYVTVLWDARNLTNRPIGLGEALWPKRFMMVLDEGQEFFAGTTSGGDEGGWAENPNGSPSGTATLTPYLPVDRAIAIGRNSKSTQPNAIAFGDGVVNDIPDSILLGNLDHKILRTLAYIVAKGLRLDREIPLTISNGSITVDGPGRYRIDTEDGAASDELTDIFGGTNGDIIYLTIENSNRDVILRDGAGMNGSLIFLPANVTLGHVQSIAELHFSSSRGGWRLLSVSHNNT